MKRTLAITLAALLSAALTADAEKTPDKEAAGSVAPIAGRCHCGYVQYEAQPPVVKSSTCDCKGCQKATGTLQAPFVTVRRPGFKVTAGEATEFRAKSGIKCDAHGTWHFCPKCGTQVFWKGNKGNEIDIFAGTLDEPGIFRPEK